MMMSIAGSDGAAQPNALEDAIKYFIALGKKPKAIIAVHLYGMPAKMNDLVDISLISTSNVFFMIV